VVLAAPRAPLVFSQSECYILTVLSSLNPSAKWLLAADICIRTVSHILKKEVGGEWETKVQG
jgi:hypothetical protein